MAEPNLHLADETLFLWMAGELEPPAAAEVEAHVGRCPECARRLAREAALEVALREVGASVPRPVEGTFGRWIAGLLESLLVPAWRRPLVLASLVLLAVVGVLAVRSQSKHRRGAEREHLDRSREAFRLEEAPSKEVFGYGDELGVTVQTREQLRFQFDSQELGPVTCSVTFETRGVGRRHQLALRLNGGQFAYAAPSMGPKKQTIRLPKKHLKKGGTNDLVFEVDSPSDPEPWAVANVRLLVRPLPVCSARGCLRDAADEYDRAETLLSEKEHAPENRFRAWVALHQTLLLLEDVEPSPDLSSLAQVTLREVDRELDSLCVRAILAANRGEALLEPRQALEECQTALKWFPQADDEHPCRARLQERIDRYRR